MFPFGAPWKQVFWSTFRFSDVFRGSQRGTLAQYGSTLSQAQLLQTIPDCDQEYDQEVKSCFYYNELLFKKFTFQFLLCFLNIKLWTKKVENLRQIYIWFVFIIIKDEFQAVNLLSISIPEA